MVTLMRGIKHWTRRASWIQGKRWRCKVRLMNPSAQDPVAQVLGQLLRQPEPQRDVELERALMRLQAARSDAAYLLLHRVLVLETALQQLFYFHFYKTIITMSISPEGDGHGKNCKRCGQPGLGARGAGPGADGRGASTAPC
jgi:hypothetical protein